MTIVSLRFGPLGADGFKVPRSSLRWLRGNGQTCRAGEPIAYCNIGVYGPQTGAPSPFKGEQRELQVALAPRVGGRLRIEPSAWGGGFLDLQTHFQWREDEVFAHIEAPDEAVEEAGAQAGEARLLMLAGRRMTELAEVRSGLHAGWYDRSRAWWGDGGEGDFGTLLGLGICDQASMLRGAGGAYIEAFRALDGPVQIVCGQDEPLVPCAPVLTDLLSRTPEQADAIADDMVRGFLDMPGQRGPADWHFMGALLAGLQRRSMTESYALLTPDGVREAGPADAVLLSLYGDGSRILRHKRLGYAVNIYPFRINEAGPAVRAWLRANFEAEDRGLPEVMRDYRIFLDAYAAGPGGTVLVSNIVSISEYEDIVSYAGFDAPLGTSVATMRSKEMNLLLHDLARERDVAIVDADAIAAELGSHWHVPDGLHPSGRMQTAVRTEIFRVLRERGVRGFARPRVS